jgi:uncharacterized phage protein (TIGR01671 family)
MREIKFRVWDKKRKIMREVSEIYYNGSVFVEKKNRFPARGDLIIGKDLSDLMQYTGLKDKNGVEIYEGDIIESTWNYNKGVVMWSEDTGEWIDIDDCNEDKKYKASTVIGNIYENPELIK